MPEREQDLDTSEAREDSDDDRVGLEDDPHDPVESEDDEPEGDEPEDDESEDDEPDDDEPDDDEPDDDDDDDDGLETADERHRGGRLSAWLLGLGGTLWALVALLRCAEPPAGPSVSIPPTEAEELAERPKLETPPEPASAETPSPPRPEDEPVSETPPEPAPDPRGPPAPWAVDAKPPTEVAYTVRRGGSMKNVANLFKIFHHEITALNPGVDLEKELPPNTKIVVYRGDETVVSRSVGLPSHGSLEGGVPMVEGPGRRLMAIPWKSWATARTVALLDRVLVRWSEHGNGQPVLVGNMSSRGGGRLEPHGTHQSGRDVDLGYIQKMAPGEEHNWREMSGVNLDAAGTWKLLHMLVETGAVEVIYVDRSIQKLLYEHALANETMTERELAAWMEYPRPTGSGSPVIQHVRGHVDHIHVRFACGDDEPQCRSKHSS
jgi:murein endopeptidase